MKRNWRKYYKIWNKYSSNDPIIKKNKGRDG